MTNTKNHTLPIIVMFSLFFMISFVTGLQNPMGVIIKSQFTLSNFASQFGNFAIFSAYAFLGIPSGLLLQKKGYKFTAKVAVVLGLIGVSLLFGSSYIYNPIKHNVSLTLAIYFIGAFISGGAMCLLNTVVNPMLNTLGGGGNKGNQLIQLGGSINSIGATIAPILVGSLMGNTASTSIGNARPALLLSMLIFMFALVVIALVNIPEPHIDQKKEKYKWFKPLAFRHLALGTIAIFLYVGLEVGIPSIANLFMTSNGNGILEKGLGMDPNAAGSVVGTYWFLMLIGRLIGVSLGAKISSKKMLTFTSSIGIIFILVAILTPLESNIKMPVFTGSAFTSTSVPFSIMMLTLCGLCTSVMWGGIFNLAVEGLGKYTPAASGIFMVMVCGGGVLPLIQGKISDLTNYLSSYWVIIIALGFLLFYGLIGSKNVNKSIKID